MIRVDRPLLWLVLAAFVVRLAWGLHQPAEIDRKNLPDQADYLELGRNLLAGRGLVMHDDRFGQDVYAFRMGGYPLLIAACGADVRAVRVVQAALDASIVAAVYILARRWMSRRAGLIAAGLVAVNPFLIYFSGLILSETLFAAMLAWGVLLLTSDARRKWIWGAVLLALSIYVRPSAVALPVVLAVAAGGLGRDGSAKAAPTRWLTRPATVAAFVVVALLPWAIRNRLVLGQWIWLTTNGGITRYDGFNPTNSTGGSDQSFVFSRELQHLRRPELREVERDAAYARRANEWIVETLRTRPLWLVELTARKIARTWSPVPLSQEYGGRALYVAAAAAYSIPFDLLVLGGLFFGRLPRSAKTFLLLPALYFTLIHAASVGSLRYRVPIEPLLAILGAAAVWGRGRDPLASRAETV